MDDAFPANETLSVRGLQADAEILIDKWGIPHLRAQSAVDGFYLQGFNAARDRLWQMDLWRKRGLGRLSASFGPGFLEQDLAARSVLYRGDMRAEYNSYADDMEEICNAFTAGINAWIDLCTEEPIRLPPEFNLTGSRPEKWRSEDVVRIRSHALTRNAPSEILRCVVLAGATTEADLLRANLEPRVEPGNASGLVAGDVPLQILDRYKLATAAVSFEPGRLQATRAEAGKWTKINALSDVIADVHWSGSNNWAVDSVRSASGRPIIAGDPHRLHTLPALRYLAHLKTPDFNVIGTGEPIAPGLCMGHNGTCAYTGTIFRADQEDIYCYQTNPENPLEYRFENRWEAMRVVPEVFEIKGYPSETHALHFTRHGPVLLEQPELNRAFALRSIWWDPGTCAYLAGVSIMRSRNIDEFQAGISRYATPSLNHVYADTSGNIAWLPYGLIPVRPNWDGLMPVAGDGRYEWQGRVPLDQMPNKINPAEGFVASANEANLPEDWVVHGPPIGYEWVEKSRARRIHDVLSKSTGHRLEDSCALQTDAFSWPGMRLQNLVRESRLESVPQVAEIARLLLDWDCVLSVGSAAGLVQEWWLHKRLKPAVFALFVPDPKLHSLMLPGDVEGILTVLENPTSAFGACPQVGRDAILISTLIETIADISEKFGSDPSRWKWGDLHHVYFEHLLSHSAQPEWRMHADVGPAPMSGSASTVLHAGYREDDFRTVVGASVRFVLDVGSWDNSRCINVPGQSGDPRSPFYSNLFESWIRGEYVPFLYSDEAVDAAVAQRIFVRAGAE